MPSSSVTYPANILTRRGALAYNLQQTPMSPTGGSSVLLYSDPQKVDGHVIDDHTRHLFPDWQGFLVSKVKSSTSAKHLLKFRCSSYSAEFTSYFQYDFNADPGIFGQQGPVFQSALWSGGDDKLYGNCTVRTYSGYDPNSQDWGYTINEAELIDGEWVNVYSDSGRTPTINSSGASWIGPNYAYDYTYGEFSNPLNYQTLMQDHATVVENYDTTNAAFYSMRQSTDDPHGISAYVTKAGYSNSYGTYDRLSTQNPSGLAALKNGLMTYVQANTSDNLAGTAEKLLVRGRWIFTPTGCGTCPFAGKTITIEAKFKKAQVTRALSGNNQTLSIGSWSDHSTHTFTLTLPDSISASQELGSNYDFPTQDGYVVALDDLKVTGIA